MATCSKCGEAMVFVRSGTTGRRFPLSPTPVQFDTLVTSASCFIVLDGEAHYAPPLSPALPGYTYFRSHRKVCSGVSRWDRVG